MNINCTIPPPGTVVFMRYIAKDGKESKRLVRVSSATEQHWQGINIIKEEPRCFIRAKIVLAQPITTGAEWEAALARVDKADSDQPPAAN